MRVFIAEDDPISRRILEETLTKRGFEVTISRAGNEAWEILKKGDAPQLAILDWMMPGMDGIELCKRIRAKETPRYTYIILLTANNRMDEIATGLDAGADDYMTKPFRAEELHARVRVGIRVLELQNSLTEHVHKLQEALSRVKRLQGLLPICAYCKKIRNDQNYWQQVEKYIGDHSEAQFSHSICPDCYEEIIKPQLNEMMNCP